MKKTITVGCVFLLLLALTLSFQSQTPQYYNANSGGIGNTLPFNSSTGYKTQWLIGPGEYGQPSPAPAGNITKFYIYMSSSGGPATYTQLTIKMGLATITTFPSGEYMGQLDTVYSRMSVSLSSTANSWLIFTLDHPFYYDPTKSLVIQVSHCGFTGTGMNVWQTAGTSGIIRRNNITGTPACVFTYNSQDTRILQNGIDISPVSLVNRCLKLPTPGVNTNYVTIPYATGMTGFQTVTIEAWIKPGSISNANTILNKGAGSFDYQLGVNATSALPFFRAMSTIATATFTVTAGQWMHIAVTASGTQVIFYKNGVAMTTLSTATTLGSSTGEMRIGRGNNDAGSGNIDEVRLWNIVRTPTQIANDMCNKWIPNNTTGLIAKWHFDSTYTDSVHGWNGTPMGSVTFDTAAWCPITGIHQNETEVPVKYELKQNYPNPFNPSTTIEFSLPKEGYVEIKLYDITGKEVAVLLSDPFKAGSYTINFNASRLSSGVYLYKIVSGDFTATKKMVLLK